jgi:hypothetical protein
MSSVIYTSRGIAAMQNRLYSNQADALAAPPADIELRRHDTGYVFNGRFNTNLVINDQNYQNDQGCSAHYQKHLERVCEICLEYLSGDDCLIVDVGCGKGGFVELLQSNGLKEALGNKAVKRSLHPDLFQMDVLGAD